MKRYYDLYEERLIAMLEWKEGYGALTDAKKHFGTDSVREIEVEEFNRLEKEYCS
ncbi:hypothetical protein ACV3RR_04840 [Clostridium perfringens]